MKLGWSAGSFVLLLLVCGCQDSLPPDSSYFDERIAPVLSIGCLTQTAGCHTPENGTSSGNLDLSSYDALMQRRDVLPAYGPYPVGLLLLKSGDPVHVAVETLDPPDPSQPDRLFVDIETDIRHTGGRGLDPSTGAVLLLKEWLESGFARTGVPVETSTENSGDCVSGAGDTPGYDPAAPVDEESYRRFVADVQPMLRDGCAGADCHGAKLADYFVTCGDSDEELHWNYWISVQHLARDTERSELLLRPLATNRGGTFHGGGNTFASPDDERYRTLESWAADLVSRAPSAVAEDDTSEGFRFFANRVQPVLVRKGCMHMNCHSPISLKLNLRGGSQGAFSRLARRINYKLARKLLAYQSVDPNQSRIIAKNLSPASAVDGGQGVEHRGGTLFEDFGADRARPDLCAAWNADTDDLNEIPAYCVMARWHEIERELAIDRGEILDEPGLIRGVLWVERPVGVGRPTDFDTYRPGADLLLADGSIGADQALTMGGGRSLLAGCGLSADTADVRGTTISWDGLRIAFAARSAATEPFRLYWANADGTECERTPGLAPDRDEENGILTHDFDPAFAPNGSLVFASTRGNIQRDAYDYEGPTRTPASLEPNANLYVYGPETDPPVRQLTFLLNQEIMPAFMADGRVIFTGEKREPGFHQLSLRRQNLDGGDFHPLYASRGSLGFDAATEVETLPNLNFVFVASLLDAPDGAGSIAIANRSIGPDQSDRDPSDRFFMHSMRVPAPGVLGGFPGVFRSPHPLPSGRVLASCEQSTMAMDGPFDFDLCELDPATGDVRLVGGRAGVAEVEAVTIYARPNRGVLQSDGKGIDRPNILAGERDSVVHFNDFPMIASLMFENTRTERPIDHRIAGFDVLETLPPPVDATDFADVSGQVVEDAYGPMFVARRTLGWVPIFADGSTKYRLPGGTPVLYRLTDESQSPLLFPEGGAFDGVMIQREQEQYYPGERIQRSIPRRFFNSVCGGCHGSITGRELDVAVDLDVVSGASINVARDEAPIDLYQTPSERGPVE